MGARVPGDDVEAAWNAAFASARAHRPAHIGEDAVQEGAFKWWRRLKRGPIPSYILESHDSDKISTTFLSYWILRSSRDFQVEEWEAGTRMEKQGFAGALINPEIDSHDLRDSTSVPFDEDVVGRLDAARAVSALGAWDEIDPILRLRADSLSYEEIAAEIGTTVGNARVRMHRERGRAARRLTELGLGDM